MAKNNIKPRKPEAPKVTLSDTVKKAHKDSAKAKRNALTGKNFDDLKNAEKDALLKSLLETFGLIDATGIVL